MQRKKRQQEGKGGSNYDCVSCGVNSNNSKTFCSYFLSMIGLFQVGYRERGGYGVVSCGANSNNRKNVFSYFLSMIGLFQVGYRERGGYGVVDTTFHPHDSTVKTPGKERGNILLYSILLY